MLEVTRDNMTVECYFSGRSKYIPDNFFKLMQRNM